jgi:hypothetical protein
MGPWTGVQWTDTMPAHAVIDYYTWGWPACWDVTWMVYPVTARLGGPSIRWKVQVERSTPYFLVYHIVVSNLTDQPIAIEGRYGILST